MRPPPLLAAFLLTTTLARAEAPPPLLAAAEELLRQVAPEHSTYKHKEPEVRWSTDPKAPAFCHTDCSGLVMAVLSRIDPKLDGEAYKRWLDARRPTARRFYDAIVAGKGFKEIAKIGDARPGDLIAAKYQPGEENTGHIMIVAEAPRKAEAKEPLIPGTEQWLVTVIDQSKSGHGPTDTRRQPDKTFRGGLGKGVFRIYARSDGEPVGYTWSTFANSKFYGEGDRGLAIGRFDPAFQP